MPIIRDEAFTPVCTSVEAGELLDEREEAKIAYADGLSGS